LRHKASELNLNMRSDGYVKVEDLLKLNMKTFANVPLRSHTDDDVKEVGSVNTFLYIHLHLCCC
jgi:2'-phosphotransferase